MADRELNLDPSVPLKAQVAKLSEEDIAQLLKQANDLAIYQKYSTLMYQIASKMKEIPVLPSEEIKPDQVSTLQKVEFPDSGGVLTWMDGQYFPYKGYPLFDFVDKIDQIKKINRAMLSGLYHQIKDKPKIAYLTLLPAIWLAKDLLRSWIYVFYRMIDRFKIKSVRYSDSVREIHRAFSVARPDENYRDTDFRIMLRDLLCMIIEFDNAYRFRLQDILSEMDKDSLQKHPVQELIRLLVIMNSREKTQEIRDTWTLLRYVIRWYLIFDRRLTQTLKYALLQLDLDKIRLSTGDKTYCIPRQDYTFGFILHPSPIDQKLLRVKDIEDVWKSESKKVKDASSLAHQQNPDKAAELDKKFDQALVAVNEQYRAKINQILETITT